MTFICKENCGKCCGCFPFALIFFNSLKSKAQVSYRLKPCPSSGQTRGGRFIVPLTEDFSCVFLNRQTKRCAVYERRPEVCRLYGLNSTLPCLLYTYKSGLPVSLKTEEELKADERDFNKLHNRQS